MGVSFRRWLGVGLAPKIQLRDWILPYWYQRQNDPFHSAYTIGRTDFRNFAFRNWTSIPGANSETVLNIDRFGVVYFPEMGVSFEFWVYSDQQLYTPANFKRISQRLADEGGVRTDYYYDLGRVSIAISPSPENGGQISCKISLISPPEDVLKYGALYCVIRPFDYNGFSGIYHLEYRNNYLWVNHRRLLFFEEEPSHCYFTNGLSGDVTKYLRVASGNTKMVTSEGLGTGMIGFSGLPAELSEVNLFFLMNKKALGKYNHRTQPIKAPDVSDSWNQITSNTALDGLLAANLRFLKEINVFFNIYQILALNRFSDGFQSRSYLKQCLKKVAWDGSLQVGNMSQEQLIWGVGDYFKLMKDIAFIEKHWPLLKRMGYAIWHQKLRPMLWAINHKNILFDQEGFYEKLFWLTGALSTLEELSFLVGDFQEALAFKEQNQLLLVRLNRLLSNCIRSTEQRVIPLRCQSGYGAGIIRNLAAAYPLQIWEAGDSLIQETIHFIFKNFYYRGGIYSPFDFGGIDLAQSARFGQVLIREGHDCTEVLKLLMAAAGGTGSLPERVDPRTLNGIGDNGHHPDVVYQLLLLIRNLFVLEEHQILELLPGFLVSKFWNLTTLRLKGLNTFFGEINCNCQSIGDLIQIDFWPNYRMRPQKIRFYIPSDFYPVYVDAASHFEQAVLEVDPGFHRLRLKKRISVGLS